MPWMSTEMPPLTPTASCSGASTSAAAAVAESVRLRKIARKSVSPTATGRASGCAPCRSCSGERRDLISGMRPLIPQAE